MIQTSYFWQIIFWLALGAILIRGSVIAVSARVTISARTKEIFSFIPAAIIPSLIAPSVFFHQGKITAFDGKERLLVALLATGVSYFSKSTLATILFGLVALYSCQFL